jgi:unsaturated rhamnogalacturonyl hydrolase
MNANNAELKSNTIQKVPTSPLDWAEAACYSLMAKYKPEALPPVGRWHYHQGVFLSGMERCWRATQKKKYYEYLKLWVDSLILPDGGIKNYDPTQLDDIQPGILLFDLYQKTGDKRYKKALNTLVSHLLTWKKNQKGGFWHKGEYPNQMWLDGLYMAGPIAVQYGNTFGENNFFDLITFQALLMEKQMKDEKTGLFYHAWDESKKAEWANPETGKSSEFWGRAIGWYATAIVDILDFLPQTHKNHNELVSILKDLLISLIKYQDTASGRWYQVVDKSDFPDNWLENSCTSLYVYAIAKAIRKGYLDHHYLQYAWKGYQGVIDTLKFDENGSVLIGDICVGTNVGDYAHYIARPTSVNDLHGAGAFILMCVEISQAD